MFPELAVEQLVAVMEQNDWEVENPRALGYLESVARTIIVTKHIEDEVRVQRRAEQHAMSYLMGDLRCQLKAIRSKVLHQEHKYDLPDFCANLGCGKENTLPRNLFYAELESSDDEELDFKKITRHGNATLLGIQQQLTGSTSRSATCKFARIASSPRSSTRVRNVI